MFRRAWMVFLAMAIPGPLSAQPVELISRIAAVPELAGRSYGPALSADGRWVAFLSTAPNLIPGQVDEDLSRNHYDTFLHDRVTGTTTLLSHAAGSLQRAGRQVSFDSGDSAPAISADGRYVAFVSTAVDLLPEREISDGTNDVFLYDRVTGTTTLISHADASPITTANGSSDGARISADGNYVAFTSRARNLVAGQTEAFEFSPSLDVFLWSRATGTVTLVSRRTGTAAVVANGDSRVTGISADGDILLFTSQAADLLPPVSDRLSFNAFLYQRSTDQITPVSRATGSPLAWVGITDIDPVLSADGRYVAFGSGANNLVSGQAEPFFNPDAFLFDRITGEMRLVSHTSASQQAAAGIPDYFGPNLAISADGRYVAFLSAATNIVPGQVDTNRSDDLFVYDRTTGGVTLVTHVPGSPATALAETSGPLWPSFSADGRFLAFENSGLPLPNDAGFPLDVFLYDRASGSTTLVSRTPDASAPAFPNTSWTLPRISADGGVTAFHSTLNYLDDGPADPNGFDGLFLYHRTSGEITSPARREPGLPAVTPNGPSLSGGISADGRFVLFLSQATSLVPGQIDMPNNSLSGTWDVFLRDRMEGKTTLLSRSPASKVTAVGGLDPVLSDSGGFAAFVTTQSVASGPPVQRLQLYNRTADTLTLVNHVPGSATEPSTGALLSPSISADGRYLLYACSGCNVVPAYQSGGEHTIDVFLYDRATGANTLVSHTSGSTSTGGDGSSENPRISANGRFAVFASKATNLIPGQIDSPDTLDLFAFDRTTGAIALVSHTASSVKTAAGLSSPDVGLSADGRFIAFRSNAPNLVPGQASGGTNIFLHDRVSGTLALVSHAAGSPLTPANGPSALFPSPSSPQEQVISISADGRFLVYESWATDLVAGIADTNNSPDVFLYDRLSGTNVLASRGFEALDHEAKHPRISADGSRITFLMRDSGTPPVRSLFAHDRVTGRTALVGPTFNVSQISADGRRIAFTTSAPMVAGDFNGYGDAYLWSAGPTPLPACTLLDTRRRTDRPALTSNVQRTIAVRGACGVPATAKQVVVKVTVSSPSGKGNLRFYPGAVTATPSGILRFERNATRTETFTLPVGTNGALTILPLVANRGTVHVAVEVTGYSQ